MSGIDAQWALEIRKLLFVLAQATDTPLPDAPIQNLYIQQIASESSGPHSRELLDRSVRLMIERWRWPSFPKPADVILAMREARGSYEFVEYCRANGPEKLLGDGEPEPTDGDRDRIAAVIAQWRAGGSGDYAELTRMLQEAGNEG